MVLTFEGTEADALERNYRGQDMAAQRQVTLDKLAVQPGERVIDIGAGPGFLAADIADLTGPTGGVMGIDISDDLIARAKARNSRTWLDYAKGDATTLPVEENSFDVAVSTQVAEYMTDLAPFCAEIARVLKPGGRGLILTTDWEGQRWYSADPDRMARILRAEMTSVAQTNVPRVLAPHLRAAGLIVTGVSCHEIVNLDRSEGNYSARRTQTVVDYVGPTGTIPAQELAAFAAEQDDLDANGAYFYSIGRYLFQFTKPG